MLFSPMSSVEPLGYLLAIPDVCIRCIARLQQGLRLATLTMPVGLPWCLLAIELIVCKIVVHRADVVRTQQLNFDVCDD